jgi:hypothetical protein
MVDQRSLGLFVIIALVTGLRISVGYISELVPSSYARNTIKGVEVKSIEAASLVDSCELQLWLDGGAFQLIYDRGNNARVSFDVSSQCNSRNIVHLLAWDVNQAGKLKALYPFDSDLEGLEVALKVLRELSITEVSLVSDDFKAKEALEESLMVTVAEYMDDNTPQASVNKLIARALKSQAVRFTVLDLPSESASRALLGLTKARMDRTGYACLISQKTRWFLPSQGYEGLLWLAEEGIETAGSQVDMDYLNLAYILSKIEAVSKAEVQRVLAVRGTKLMNFLSGAWVEVGYETPQGFLLTRPVTFFGGLHKVDFNLPVSIPLSTVSGPESASGLDGGNPEAFTGFFIALNKLHSEGLLGRFLIEPHPIPCGAVGYSPDFASACFKSEKNSLGILIVTSYSSSAVIGQLEALEQEAINITVLGPYNWSTRLSDKKVYPRYTRITKRDNDIYPGLGQFMRNFKYDYFNIFTSDDFFSLEYAGRAVDALRSAGVTNITPYNMWPITAGTMAVPADYLEQGEFVKKSNIRPIITMSFINERRALLDVIHKVGLGAQDVIFWFDSFSSEVLADSDPQVVKYRSELVQNIFTFDFAAFVGTLGEQAKQLIANATAHPATPGNCQYYDGAYFIAYTLKSMITRGEDFEDPDLLNDRLRKTQMYGCTGRIIIESDSNDRSSQDIDIYSSRLVDGEFHQSLTYRISLTTSTFITEISKPVWPGNSTEAPPLHILNYKDCPFPEEYRQDYSDGVQVMAYIGAVIGGVALIVRVLVCIFTRKESQVLLTEKFVATFEDLVQQYSVPFNAVQYLALGPTLMSSFNISAAFKYFLTGPYGVLDLENTEYWKLLNVLFAVHSAWLLGFILVVLRYNQLKRRLNWLTGVTIYSIPLLSLFLFLPSLLTFLQLFVCSEAHSPPGTSPSLEDTFMDKDCEQDCWEGPHLSYSIITCIFCSLFITTQSFATSMWQVLTPDMNIRARRSYLHWKSCSEVVLLLSSHIVKRQSEAVHAVIYIAVLLLLLLDNIFRRAYSYSRLNLWLGVWLSICLCLGSLGLIQLHVTWFRGVTGDWMALGVVVMALGEAYLGTGLGVQRCYFPNLVKSTNIPYEAELFIFAFDLRNVKPPQSVLTRGGTIAIQSTQPPSQEPS